MKKNKHFLILGIAALSLFANASCEKNGVCIAGTGGAVMIAAFPKYSGNQIFSTPEYRDSAFVKFNAQASPGARAENYDLVIAGNVGENHVHIPNLKCGDYFIYVTGFDTTINKRVTGGIAYNIVQNYGSEIDIDISVN